MSPASKHFGFQYSDSEAGEAQERILQFLDVSDVISRENSYSDIASDIKLLWEHPVTKECLKKKNEFQFLDSAPYFLDKASEISSPDYKPSDEDVLRARSQTTGIITFKFQVDIEESEGRRQSFYILLKVNNKNQNQNFDFELIDVGGQRTERRKWIHCFEDVTAGMSRPRELLSIETFSYVHNLSERLQSNTF